MARLRHTEIGPSMELIRSLKARGITIIVVEHVMKAILAVSDPVLVLHQGEILTSSDPQEVLRDLRVIEAYLGHRYAKRTEADS
jgi:branched-chain amino acid transport system ATP-binding protein